MYFAPGSDKIRNEQEIRKTKHHFPSTKFEKICARDEPYTDSYTNRKQCQLDLESPLPVDDKTAGPSYPLSINVLQSHVDHK